jgi:hypothetical protein
MGEVNGIKSLGVALLMAGMVTHAGTLAAQEVKHLNPVIEKLAAGKPFIGFQTGDLTLGTPAPCRVPMPTTCMWTWSIRRWIFPV